MTNALNGPIPSISFSNLKTLTLADSSLNETAGRKFTVSDGVHTEKVIFNHLFKQAQALLSDAQTREECVLVEDFLKKLHTLEESAQTTYENRGIGYKFMSFWHRLFGGAYFGTHLKRLDHLETKCHKKEERLLNTLKEEATPIKHQVFIENSFETFTAGEKNYTVWKELQSNKKSVLHICNEENKELLLTYREDKCVSIKGAIDGDELSVINALERFSVQKKERLPELTALIQPLFNRGTPTQSTLIEIEGRAFRIRREWDQTDEFASLLHIEESAFPEKTLVINLNHGYPGSATAFHGTIPEDISLILGGISSFVKEKEESYSSHFHLLRDNPQELWSLGFSQQPLTIPIKNQNFSVWYEEDAQNRRTFHIQNQENKDKNLSFIMDMNDDCVLLSVEGNLSPKKLSRILNAAEKRSKIFWHISTEKFRSVTGTPETFVVSDIEYSAWKERSPSGQISIHIQEKAHLGTQDKLLVVHCGNENKQFSLKGIDGDLTPETLEVIEGYLEFLGYQPDYWRNAWGIGVNINIDISQKNLVEFPLLHLERLGNFLPGVKSPKNMQVKYHNSPGYDLGGLKRDYVSTLIGSLENQKHLFITIEDSSLLPSLKGEGPFSKCNAETASIFQSLGKLFALCHASKYIRNSDYDKSSVVTGKAFPEVLFKVMLSLTEKELNQPLGLTTQVKMAKELVSFLDSGSENSGKNILNCLNLLLPGNLASATKSELNFAATLVGGEYLNEDSYEAEPDLILQNEEDFKQKLYDQLFSDATLVKTLNGATLGSVLDPIFQMAVGMKSQVVDWQELQEQKISDVSDKVQGVLDRDLLISNMKYDGYDRTISRKIGWLKDWIKEEASEEELKAFLKYVTGSTSLSKNKNIEIQEQAVSSPIPSASTCGMKLLLSSDTSYDKAFFPKEDWDDSRKKFVKSLKFAIEGTGFTKG